MHVPSLKQQQQQKSTEAQVLHFGINLKARKWGWQSTTINLFRPTLDLYEDKKVKYDQKGLIYIIPIILKQRAQCGIIFWALDKYSLKCNFW